MPTKNLTFPGSTGAMLSASVDYPDGEVQAWALFAHCFTCNRKMPSASRTCRELARRGIAALRFDFTGLGDSDGDFAATTFATNIADLQAAYDFMEEHLQAPEVLIGHSLGAAAAINAVSEMPHVQAVATIGAPFSALEAMERLAAETGDFAADDSEVLHFYGRTIPLTPQVWEALRQVDAQAAIEGLNRPLLVVHSPSDRVVDVNESARIYAAANFPKSVMSLDGADHLLRRKGSAARAAGLIYEWAQEYIP